MKKDKILAAVIAVTVTALLFYAADCLTLETLVSWL
jgi:hypothetical protein